jgi:hypothetical protein
MNEQPAPEVLIMVEVDGAEGPMTGVPLGFTERIQFQYTWTGILRLLLLQNRCVQVEVTILDVAMPDPDYVTAAERASFDAWYRKAVMLDRAAGRLLGTCQGLIECFEAGDPWTPEARANAVAELRKGIEEMTQ